MDATNSERRNLERLVNLTDAALAITLTLLMLDIRLPAPAEGMSDTELLGQLLALWPRYFAYALSFVVIALFWISHRQKFAHIVRGDTLLTWLNIAFLLVLGLIPFVTSLIADNPGKVATIAYAGVMSADSLVLLLLWWRARSAHLTGPSLSRRENHRAIVASTLGAAVFALSIPLALYDADYAKFFWLALLLMRPISMALAGRGRGD